MANRTYISDADTARRLAGLGVSPSREDLVYFLNSRDAAVTDALYF